VTDRFPSQLRDESLMFMGSMIAGQSHEITNVLNIISELSGLQRDLLLGAERGQSLNAHRLDEIAERIQFQVLRGDTIVRNINSFAHSVDLPVAVFDLKETMERVIFLADRPARLGKIELLAVLPEETVALENNPFCVQHATFICIDIGLRAASKNRKIKVGYDICENGVEISVKSADPLIFNSWMDKKLRFLDLLLVELGGVSLKPPSDEEKSRLIFFIPKHRGDVMKSENQSRAEVINAT